MKTFTLTEEDIGDIFIFMYEDGWSGKFKPPQGVPGEDQVQYMQDYFVKIAEVVIATRDKWEKGLLR